MNDRSRPALPARLLAFLVFTAGPALAHDVRGEIAFLDAGDRAVAIQLGVSVPQLALARGASAAQLIAAPRETRSDEGTSMLAIFTGLTDAERATAQLTAKLHRRRRRSGRVGSAA